MDAFVADRADAEITPDDRAFALYLRAHDLHTRGREAGEAEALYRAAIAAGFDRARFNLGILLRDLGREHEAERLLKAAVSTDDSAVAARAALAAANLIDLGRDDPIAARPYYGRALERGTSGIRDGAALALALHSAATGDRKMARTLIQYVTQRRYRRSGVDPIGDDAGLRFATTLSSVLTWRPAHGSARFSRRLLYRARVLRRRIALVGLRAAIRISLSTRHSPGV